MWMKEDDNATLSLEDFQSIKNGEDLRKLLHERKLSTKKVEGKLQYEMMLNELQVELVKLQQWVKKNNHRVAIIFEGRDAAGKGGSIRRFMEHLNPRSMRLVALNKPTEVEQGQWYFRRYIKRLPNPGEIVFFDRSWYNRAVVEPVMGFCSDEQYDRFMVQVPEFEHMLREDGVIIIKMWFSITKAEQLKRFNSRLKSPVKRWKFSPIDKQGQELWDRYSFFKSQMFSKTHSSYSPWTIIKTNDKHTARLESIRHVLAQFKYDNKSESLNLLPDPNTVLRYQRTSLK